jgi:hypothetical protein
MQLLEIAQRQHRLVRRSDVEAVGLSSRQWCRRVDELVWSEVAPGVWCHAAVPQVWELRVRAGLMWLGTQAALFGPTAAAWWGLDGFDRAGRVEFVVPRGRRGVPPRMVLHTTSVWTDVTRHDGLRLTSATRTIIDLAGQRLPARRIEDAIDAAMRLKRSSLPTLHRRLAVLGGSGRPGTQLLRELLLDSGGESFLERRFLRLMRRSGLPRPACQVVHKRSSTTVARVDFQFTSTGVIVEVSGRLGHSSDADRRRDARRRNALQQRGFLVIEFTTADVLDDEAYVVATIERVLAGSRPSSTTPAVVKG